MAQDINPAQWICERCDGVSLNLHLTETGQRVCAACSQWYKEHEPQVNTHKRPTIKLSLEEMERHVKCMISDEATDRLEQLHDAVENACSDENIRRVCDELVEKVMREMMEEQIRAKVNTRPE